MGSGSSRAEWTIRLKYGASTPTPLRRQLPIRTRFNRHLPLLLPLRTVVRGKKTLAALSLRCSRIFPYSTRVKFTPTTSTVSTGSVTLSFLNRAKTRSSVGNLDFWAQISPRKRAKTKIKTRLPLSIASTTKNATFGSCASHSPRLER